MFYESTPGMLNSCGTLGLTSYTHRQWSDTEPCPLHLSMLLLRSALSLPLSLSTWQSLAWLPIYSSLYPFSGYGVPLPCALCMTIFTPSSSSDNDDLFPPHLSHPSFPSLAKICPIPAAHKVANVDTAVESGGRGAWDRRGDNDSDIDTVTCICMNTHICIISKTKWYKYTHIDYA